MRIAYLTSQYPAASHTFIRREVEALREQGVAIDTFSIRKPGSGEASADADKAEAGRTFYVLAQSPLAIAAANLATFVTRPAAYLKTFGLALGHRAPGARGLFLGLAHFAESVLLARELRLRNTEHLHNHFANSAATVGLLATRLLGIGWSFTMHGISETDYPAGLLLGEEGDVQDPDDPPIDEIENQRRDLAGRLLLLLGPLEHHVVDRAHLLQLFAVRYLIQAHGSSFAVGLEVTSACTIAVSCAARIIRSG